MKRREKYLLILLAVYSTLFIMKKAGIYFPIINDYFSDLICIPLSLLFISWFSERLTGKEMDIGHFHILIAIFYFSFVFELWMPSVSKNYTADFIDVVCYFSGGILYLIFFKGKSESSLAV